MDSEIIVLSDDDDDTSPPPRAHKPDPASKTAAQRPASDRPCPLSKKKHYGNDVGRGDGACARPATSAARPGASTTRPAASATRPAASATRPAATATRTVASAARPAATIVRQAAANGAVGSARPSVAARPAPPTAVAAKYPPPYPSVPRHATPQASWSRVPPQPTIRFVGAGADGSVELAWKMESPVAARRWAEVKAYEMYVCRETDKPPDTSMWRLVEEITGQPLPEGCVLVNCPPGVHHIALRAIDVHDRRAPFSSLTVTI